MLTDRQPAADRYVPDVLRRMRGSQPGMRPANDRAGQPPLRKQQRRTADQDYPQDHRPRHVESQPQHAFEIAGGVGIIQGQHCRGGASRRKDGSGEGARAASRPKDLVPCRALTRQPTAEQDAGRQRQQQVERRHAHEEAEDPDGIGEVDRAPGPESAKSCARRINRPRNSASSRSPATTPSMLAIATPPSGKNANVPHQPASSPTIGGKAPIASAITQRSMSFTPIFLCGRALARCSTPPAHLPAACGLWLPAASR